MLGKWAQLGMWLSANEGDSILARGMLTELQNRGLNDSDCLCGWP